MKEMKDREYSNIDDLPDFKYVDRINPKLLEGLSEGQKEQFKIEDKNRQMLEYCMEGIKRTFNEVQKTNGRTNKLEKEVTSLKKLKPDFNNPRVFIPICILAVSEIYDLYVFVDHLMCLL